MPAYFATIVSIAGQNLNEELLFVEEPPDEVGNRSLIPDWQEPEAGMRRSALSMAGHVRILQS